ncbi:MAG: YbjN domain-containing protein [Alphaproteobacteria bacterium]|nr:YbjN domain-containing protein [Alphaproteobacteria bacterium]
MIGVPFELSYGDNNPLDLVEELAESKGWSFSRYDDTAINITLPGRKAKLDVSMEWQEEFSALLVACSIPLEIGPKNQGIAIEALEKINKNMWLGHFDLSNKDKYPTFRHTLLLRMIPAGIAVDIIADVFEIALAECDRFYATFHMAQKGDMRLHDDLDAVVFETVGEA